jgi:hypothetical protein
MGTQTTRSTILSPKNEHCTEINGLIVNTLIQDDSRTSGEHLYRIELLNILSPSGLTPPAQSLKINAVFISFILQQLITLQLDKFPIKIAFDMTINKAQWQARKLVAVYLPSPVFFFPCTFPCGILPDPLHSTTVLLQ